MGEHWDRYGSFDSRFPTSRDGLRASELLELEKQEKEQEEKKRKKYTKKSLKCQTCGEDGLKWIRVFGTSKKGGVKWLPGNSNGDLHYCRKDDSNVTAEWFIALTLRCPSCEESFDAANKDFWKQRKNSIDDILYKRNQRLECPHCGISFFANFELGRSDWSVNPH